MNELDLMDKSKNDYQLVTELSKIVRSYKDKNKPVDRNFVDSVLLSCIKNDVVDVKNGIKSSDDNDVFGYENLEENPIRVCTAKNASRLSRRGPFGMRFKIARPIANEGGASLRLVYGPKLDKLNVYPKKGDEKRK